LKRRVEREENNKKKRSKTIEKKNKKKLGRMVAPVHNFDPKILPEGSAKLRLACGGQVYLIFHSLCVPVERKRPLTWAAQVRQI
jgi:hypothetical protein